MKKLTPTSPRNTFIIFILLAAVFCVQMLWWIFFQVRNAEYTRRNLAEAFENERTWTIQMLNSHYIELYKRAGERAEKYSEGKNVLPDAIDPAVSGFCPFDSSMDLTDSLYFSFAYGKDRLILFLNRDYPERILAINSRLEITLPNGGELPRPDWITENMVHVRQSGFDNILEERNRHIKMFLMEGSFFFILIAIGAYLIYLSLKRSREVREAQLLFVHSITHELKIPITSISLFLDTIKKRNYDSELVGRLAPKMKEDIIRLNQLIDNILQVRRLSDKEIEVRLETVDLSSELRRFAGTLKDRIEAAGGKLQLNIEGGIFIKAGLKELLKVWETLIDNSIKYTPAGSLLLNINLKSHREQAEMEFLDNGPGVPSGTEEKLFEPFFRGNIETQKTVPGSGLGLYIAREYVRHCKGHISIKNGPSGGCLVTLKFRKVK
ncbi:putative Histidine kinase [Candidatus Zixiibacteriota bacterium]|nr:putative Histidine kinase [candidate division Zixibacteria bacterium]